MKAFRNVPVQGSSKKLTQQKNRLKPEFRQLLMWMSTSRYFPARGTAGLYRSLVKGYSRVPRPPTIITTRTRFASVMIFALGVLFNQHYEAR